jgi:hypothetical protein
MLVLQLQMHHRTMVCLYHHNYFKSLHLLLDTDEAEHALGCSLLKLTRVGHLCMVLILARTFIEARHMCRRLVVVLIHGSGLARIKEDIESSVVCPIPCNCILFVLACQLSPHKLVPEAD